MVAGSNATWPGLSKEAAEAAPSQCPRAPLPANGTTIDAVVGAVDGCFGDDSELPFALSRRRWEDLLSLRRSDSALKGVRWDGTASSLPLPSPAPLAAPSVPRWIAIGLRNGIFTSSSSYTWDTVTSCVVTSVCTVFTTRTDWSAEDVVSRVEDRDELDVDTIVEPCNAGSVDGAQGAESPRGDAVAVLMPRVVETWQQIH